MTVKNVKSKKTKSAKHDSTDDKKRLVLLDAHAIIHRAYHALPDFSSSAGEPTGALYGLSSMLLKLVKDLKPDYLIACYDLPEPTYRHEVYKEYKAGRAKTDDDLVKQLERSRDVFKAFNVRIYDHKGFEADDILGTIVEKVKDNKNVDTIIASGDMDTLQLVDGKKVQVYTLRKGITDTIMYDETAVISRFGFKPELLPDYKGLRGDPSDNIIGIKGIGEKTATILIKAFGTIENMYKELKMSDSKFEKAGLTPRIINLLKENEEEALFSKMLALIRRDAPIDFEIPGKKWEEELQVEDVLSLFADLNFRTLARRVENMFGVASVPDIETKEKESISTKAEAELTLALWVLCSDVTNPQLEDVLQFTKTSSYKSAREKIFKELNKTKLIDVYTNIELPLIPIVEKMRERGIKLDIKYFEKLSKEYHKELSKLEAKIWKHAGEEFNINSPRQLGDILFEKLNLHVKNQKKTSTGQKSTRESELEKLKDEHPIISDILSYRELQKLLSTYIDNLPHMVDKKGGLHATFLLAGAATGRMASHNPNLQNIPIRSDLGAKIRNGFVARPGFVLVSFDYSQVELRIAAFLSGDKKLIEIFEKGGDIHQAVASEVFGVSLKNVDSEMRRRAKVINFGIIYGMGVNALKANLGTSRAEAQQFYNDYFEKFKGLAVYLDHTKADAARRGYTETLFGRRRYFEGINSRLPHIKAQAERMAINAPVQGTGADIVKIAMLTIDNYIVENNHDKEIYLLLQVHDELMFEVKKNIVEKVCHDIKKIMESVVSKEDSKNVPLTVDVSVGTSWGKMDKQL
ncbi:hypothetical protein IIC45_00385 [Patescibacteria group bacterium]|nr:hypothetical protein [Patescibacteria group bacterium]